MYIRTLEEIFLASQDRVIPAGETVEIDTVDKFAVDEANELVNNHMAERVWKDDDFVISDLIGDVQDPTRIDFTIIGLRKETPKYDKGRKTSCQYFHPESGKLAVEKTFSDILEGGDLSAIEILFTWYDNRGEVKIAKVERAITFNKYSAMTENRKRRSRAVDYLVAGSVGTPLESYVAMIFDHYQTQIQNFVATGSDSFQSAIVNETNPQIKALLGIQVAPQTHPGYTLQMSMLGQIT